MLQKPTHDTAKERKEEEREIEEDEEREMMQHDQDEAREPTTFNISQENRRYFPRFDTHGREITITVRQPPEGLNPLMWLNRVFAEVHAYLTNSSNPNDYIGVTFTADTLALGPVWMSYRHIRDFQYIDLWELVSRAAQSATNFCINDSCTLTSCLIRHMSGGSRRKITQDNVAKRSILTITNTDNLCLPRSLVTARAYAERGEIRSGELHRHWMTIRLSRGRLQREKALELIRNAKINIPDNGCSIAELEHFQKYLAIFGIAIVVYEVETLGYGGETLYDGTTYVMNSFNSIIHTLRILYYRRLHHFEPILNLRAAVGSRGFCVSCNIAYTRISDHKCLRKCNRCMGQPPCAMTTNPRIKCDSCKRSFYNNDCFQQHLKSITLGSTNKRKNKRSVCDTLKICSTCSRFISIDKKRKHDCNITYCKICKDFCHINHLCYIQPIKQTKDNRPKIVFLFYDFETQQTMFVKGDDKTRVHVPTLCVVQQTCSYCLNDDDDDMTKLCQYCGVREYVFDQDPVKQLVDLATKPLHSFNRTICIAHNAKAFDAQFILRYFATRSVANEMPSIILNGTNIIVMTIGHTTFLDSLNYLHMPLSALPKAFALNRCTAKGTFPHLFNTPENQNYIGPLPDLKYYSSCYMQSDERKRFLIWYNETKRTNYIFDFAKEIVSYCKNDVTILRRACLAFRKMFIECGKVCPFEESTTIASACSRVYRKNFLKKDRIGIIPTGGYRWGQNQSRKAVSWLIWMEHELGLIIAHAGHGRETRLPEGVLVDGYYEEIIDDAVIKHVLQFHGCYWHGCPRCYTVNRNHGVSTDTMDARLERTQFIAAKIVTAGYILTEMWECAYDRILTSREDMRIFLENHPIISRKALNPRDAFYGGRTEAMVSLYDVKGNEKIHYVDVCSLYPYICKTGKFPVGHPKVYVGIECLELTGPTGVEIDRVEGLVHCTILPPRTLYHPVLPVRMHGKLMFALCRTCCENMCQTVCTHENAADREFTGTWVVHEIHKAVSVGYKITNIYEIWQYEVTQYNPQTKEGGHFTEYINTFLKIKQEASGWPSDCVDEESKIRYIDEYERAEGIKLDSEKICTNPGLRAVSKLCLNSFWGKFGQRENLPKVEIVTTRNRLIQLLSSSEVDVTSILPINDDVLYVGYVNTDENLTPSSITNVVIAAYTTAQARLKLYEYLERLGKRALYCDTDSCIYVSGNSSNDYEPPTGKLLGDLTNELACYGEGSYIESFVSGGPKFYAFVVRKPDGSTVEICKAKGITLNFANSKLINYHSVRSLVTNERDTPIILRFSAIRRTKFHNVVTSAEHKTCKPTFDKRRRDVAYGSLPYGYCNL